MELEITVVYLGHKCTCKLNDDGSLNVATNCFNDFNPTKLAVAIPVRWESVLPLRTPMRQVTIDSAISTPASKKGTWLIKCFLVGILSQRNLVFVVFSMRQSEATHDLM